MHLPRVECQFHNFQQEKVPFADGSSHYTKSFENHVIGLLLDGTPVLTVANNLGLSWGAIDGTKERSVLRGERRRERISVRHIGIDETSFSCHCFYQVMMIINLILTQ